MAKRFILGKPKPAKPRTRIVWAARGDDSKLTVGLSKLTNCSKVDFSWWCKNKPTEWFDLCSSRAVRLFPHLRRDKPKRYRVTVEEL